MNSLIKLKKTEQHLYIIGVIIFFLFFVMAILFEKNQIHFVNYIKPCPIRQVTGYYCPGCGGTRALDYFLEGQLFQSFFYHPVILYSFAIYLSFMISNTLQILLDLLAYMTGHVLVKKRIGMIYRDAYLWLCLFVILVNFVVKNIFVVFHIHLIN